MRRFSSFSARAAWSTVIIPSATMRSKHGDGALNGGRRRFQRVAIVRLRQHADQERSLGKRYILNADAEIIPRRIVKSVHVARMRHDIHVAGENFGPRQTRKDPDGENRLDQLALEAVFLLQQDRAGELLRDGAAALPVAERKVPGGAHGGREIDGAMGKEALVLAGNHRILENLRKLAGPEPRRADHVLDIDAAGTRVLELAGGQDGVEQSPAGQVPLVALGDDLHTREGDGEGQSGENNEGDPGAEGPPPKAQTPSGFATNWPLHNRDSHGQSYCSGTSVQGSPSGQKRLPTLGHARARLPQALHNSS